MFALFTGCRAPKALFKGPRRGVEVGRGCGCGASKRAAEVLSALKMTTAAMMHATPNNAYISPLWRAHIAEEESTLFPLLRKIDPAGTKQALATLMASHDVYKPLIDQGLPLPTGSEPHSIDAHSKLEDELIERYADQLLAAASHSGQGVATGEIAPAPAKAPPSDRGPRIALAAGAVFAIGAAIVRTIA